MPMLQHREDLLLHLKPRSPALILGYPMLALQHSTRPKVLPMLHLAALQLPKYQDLRRRYMAQDMVAVLGEAS